MLTRAEAGEYKQLLWSWKPGKYRLSTCEFSEDGEFQEMDYQKYLTLWKKRLGNCEIIKDLRRGSWVITLVERGEV